MLAVTATIGYEGNLPKFYVNGKAQYPFVDVCGCSSTGGCGAKWVDDYVAHATKTVGPRILQMGCEDADYLKPDGSYDWSILDRKAAASLAIDPDAQLQVNIRFRFEPWAVQNPDEAVVYDAGPAKAGDDEFAGRPIRPSAASLRFRAKTLETIGSMADHVKKASWGNHVVGVRLNYGLYTEWHTYGIGGPNGADMSRPMTEAFRRFLKEKYGTDAALQKAWGDASATIAAATVPKLAERSTGAVFHDPVKGRRTTDYLVAAAHVNLDLLLAQAKEVKRVLPGRLVGAYYGYVFHGLQNEGATFLLDKVLASPDIDFLSDPPDYSRQTRLVGGDYAHRTVVSSFHRYGKVSIIEDDMRFSFMTNWASQSWCAKTSADDVAAVKRNVLNTLFDRCGYQVCDPIDGRGKPGRHHSFDRPHVLAAQRAAFDVLKGVTSLPADSGVDMALVVNYRDKFCLDISNAGKGSRGYLKAWQIYRDLPWALRQTGAAFDVLTLDDLLASKKGYRNLVFVDGYAPTADERAALKRLTRKPGVTAVWFIAPGSVTDAGFSNTAMSDLVGMDLIGAGTDPKVVSCDAAATPVAVAGGGWAKALPEGARAVFFPDVPTTPEAAAGIVDLLGEHRYEKSGAFVRRYGDYLMVHVGKAGSYQVTLPPADAGRTMTEAFTGKTYAGGTARLSSTGAETWFFRVGK